METGERTSEGFGDLTQLFQKRAVMALPVLIRQALAETTIFYADLSKELGMSNARNLNYVLGAVGGELARLSRIWLTKIPPLTCIVINQQDGLPGNGVGWFVEDGAAFKKKSFTERRRIVDQTLSEIYSYPRWDDVLAYFEVEPSLALTSEKLKEVSLEAAQRYGEGEGDRHKDLKLLIARNPQLVGLPRRLVGEVEHPFPSADKLDVLFKRNEEWIGIEVKGPTSDDVDLQRGLFQCVKYQAFLEAEQRVLRHSIDCRTILVTTRPLSSHLERIRLTLGVALSVVEM